MYTTYRIRTDELNDDFLTSLKTLFRDKTIEIAVCEADDESEDETAYLLRDPANRRRLMDAIENVRQGRLQLVDLDTDS
jgi:antitoxin YefM